ncbi:MAG: MFS transporter [Micavibrio aeruginosavorus]|uniref:MFS transporter n=1 Tax=Micavibrio aeruginosavorus TaxID=349221 RepID=A0A2W5N2C9_9BACT|nr:MAG: MFS transporter [Micavibrio aeruginosavorus]
MADSKLSFSVLRIREFRLLLFTRMFALSALQAQGVIIGWQIYTLTRDPFLLGLAGLMEAVPAIGCALFAGYVVDHSRPQRVYLYCLLGLMLNTLFLFLIGSGLVPLATHHFLPLAYAAIFISGFARSFIMPSSFSLLAQIVPRKDISSASAWMSTGFQGAMIVAPAIAGVIFGGYGPIAAWTMPMFLMTAAFFMMFGIKPAPYVAPSQMREPAVKSIKEGWNFIMRTPVLLGAMSLDMLAVLFGGAIALLPAFATDILNVGSEGLGILRGAPAMGAVVMALYLAVRPMKTIPVTRLLWVVVGFGVSMIGFGLSTHFVLSVAFLALSGMFDSVSMVIRQTLMQLLTPDHMRGRVSSVNSMFIISSNEIGAFESGALAKLIGVVPAVVAGGVGTLLVAGGAAWLSPEMRKTVIHPETHDEDKKAS